MTPSLFSLSFFAKGISFSSPSFNKGEEKYSLSLLRFVVTNVCEEGGGGALKVNMIYQQFFTGVLALNENNRKTAIKAVFLLCPVRDSKGRKPHPRLFYAFLLFFICITVLVVSFWLHDFSRGFSPSAGHKKQPLMGLFFVPREGLEPPTVCLRGNCSTN